MTCDGGNQLTALLLKQPLITLTALLYNKSRKYPPDYGNCLYVLRKNTGEDRFQKMWLNPEYFILSEFFITGYKRKLVMV